MNVLSDLDGTLTDPRLGILACLKHALCSIGFQPPEDRELERFIGPPLHESLAAIGALWGYGSREELRAAGARVLCSQPSMLDEAVSFQIGVQPTSRKSAPS